MKKMHMGLVVTGFAIAVVGLGAKLILGANGLDNDFAMAVIAFGKSAGAFGEMSLWEAAKLWLLENNAFCIGLGVVMAAVGWILGSVEYRRDEQKRNEQSYNVGKWRCPDCGHINSKSRVSCQKCGTIAR